MKLLNLLRPAAVAVRQRFGDPRAKAALDPASQRMVDFNRRKWPQSRTDRDSVILLGMLQFKSWLFNCAWVTNFLADKYGARIESYHFIRDPNPALTALYESFGAPFTLGRADALKHERRAQREAAEIHRGLRTKWDVINIAVDGVLIGDQIYDSYLRFFNEATLRIDDPRFKDVLAQALRIFYAAREYLSRTKVSAFITDDFSYINSGIITRLMFLAKVPIYMVVFGEPFYVVKLNSEAAGAHGFPPPAGHTRYYAYPAMFAAMSTEEKTAALSKARSALEERLTGKLCELVNMPCSTYSTSSERVLENGPEPRILVMMHDFVDSPHGYGGILFPDFYEWITFLLERAEQTPFRWYVKPHPCTLDPSRAALNKANDAVVAELKQRFPKITFLPATASNLQILSDGVAAMFTVHGTAGHEFAYRGVPVVNCGDNPHIGYDFNIHARTLEEYEVCIRTADRLQVPIDPRKIEEFFYMNYYYLNERLGSPTNPIDERIFASPDWGARMEKPEIFDEFIAGATPERECGINDYLDRVLNHPERLNTPLAL